LPLNRPARFGVLAAARRWPLLGDAASQEHGHSRLVDARTARLEISLRPRHEAAARRTLADWQLAVNGYRLPLRREDELDGETRVFGLRYRRFKPWIGLHPSLEAQGPIELTLSHPSQSEALWITLHEWRPQGGGYDGLPHDLADAAARRAERFAIKRLDTAQTPGHCPDLPIARATVRCPDALLPRLAPTVNSARFTRLGDLHTTLPTCSIPIPIGA